VDFSLFPWRFCFTATDSIHFPPGKSANILRGALGVIFRSIACVPDCPGAQTCDLRRSCAYARIFEPRAEGDGPSGLADWPRPFVFRAAHLDGRTVRPGDCFHFDLHVFDLRDPVLAHFVLTFAQLAREGLGPRRGRAHLDSVWQQDLCLFESGRFQIDTTPLPLTISLVPSSEPLRSISVQFLTPLELKSNEGGADRPEFSVLFSRARDRVATLRELYGAGPLELDFRGMGERARAVRMTAFRTAQVVSERRSSRTGQVHSLGGIIGSAVYEGDLREFLPILHAVEWTGVGRQTVWGKGHILVESA
jgi:hypothetical protein